MNNAAAPLLEREVEIVNRLGLHARAAARFVATAGHFHCDIHVRRDDRTVNGKSIMGVMMLAAACGCRLTIEARGEDAEEALAALTGLVAERFGEEE